MLKITACIFLAACAPMSGLAGAEEPLLQPAAQNSTTSAPQALSDAELDAITAGTVIVIISNPGRGNVFNIEPPTHFICVNCGGPSDKTNGIVITPSGKFIVIPGGPL